MKKHKILIRDGYVNGEPVHRAGSDFTFSAPKIISCIALTLDDQRAIQAHDIAVAKTLEFIEKDFAQTRLSTNNKKQRVNTGNLVIAKFKHGTNRLDEPNLHTHCVILNLTKSVRGWRTIENKGLLIARKMFDVYYKNQMTYELRNLGISATMVHDQITGVVDIKVKGMEKVAELFCKRTEQIKEKMAELKQTTKIKAENLREKANFYTRLDKSGLSAEQIKAGWDKTLEQANINKQDLQAELKQGTAQNNSTALQNNIDKIINQIVNQHAQQSPAASRVEAVNQSVQQSNQQQQQRQ